MNEKERLNTLETALKNESFEHEFYLKHAEKTNNPLGKAMFKRIADDELEHCERLKELHDIWQKQDKWPETIPLKVNRTNIKEILTNTIQGIDKTAKSQAGDLDAIKIAIDFEDKGVQFYRRLSDAVTDPKEKEFFELLSGIENEHYLSLKEAEEYFIDPASWFRNAEHHGLDGA
jgi:rubrerythrin